MKRIQYSLKSIKIPYQMHDEEITKIIVSKNSVQLYVDKLHFVPNYSKAIIEFNGIDDVFSCVYVDVYDMECCNILGGQRYYAEEFDSMWGAREIKLIILDILVGYGGMLMIIGKISEGDVIGEKYFSFVVYASYMTYILQE